MSKNQQAYEEFPFHQTNKPFRAGFVEKGFHFPLHYHDAVEIIFVVQGNVQVEVNHQKFSLDQGDWLVIGSHHMHAYEAYSKDVKFYLVLMATDLFRGFSHFEDLFHLLNPYLYQVTRGSWESRSNEINLLLLRLLENNTHQGPGYEVDLVIDFLRLIKELWLTSGFLPQDRSVQQKLFVNHDFVRGFHHVLFLQYTKGLTLNRAAELMGYSPFHFTRKFKQVMGMGFKEYVNRFMIKQAGIDLEYTTQSITEITFNHGFQSIKTFHRIFVEHFGTSPSNYRKAINEKSRARSDKQIP